jgi:hypothetical protein
MISRKRCVDRIDGSGSDHGMDAVTVLGLVWSLFFIRRNTDLASGDVVDMTGRFSTCSRQVSLTSHALFRITINANIVFAIEFQV